MKEIFDNRSIAIIGNAKSLFDKEYGSEIDSHDVVIRINKGIEVCTRERDFLTHGRKTNIWCFNLYSDVMEIFDNKMKKQLTQTYSRMQMNYSSVLKKYDYTISREVFSEIQNIFAPKQVTTGFRVLHHVSKFNPKSIDVYGFDWKETPTFYVNDYKSIADLNHDYKKEKAYCFQKYFDTDLYNLKN